MIINPYTKPKPSNKQLLPKQQFKTKPKSIIEKERARQHYLDQLSEEEFSHLLPRIIEVPLTLFQTWTKTHKIQAIVPIL